MTFIDIPYRLAVKATCTNRKCNILVFGVPLLVLKKKIMGSSDRPSSAWGVYLTTFVDISYRLALKATFRNRKCNISDFGGLDAALQDFYGLI